MKRRSAYVYAGERSHSRRPFFLQTRNLQKFDAIRSITSFTDDEQTINFAKHFCDKIEANISTRNGRPSMAQFCSQVLQECCLHNTQEALPIYISLRNSIDTLNAGYELPISSAWDFRLIRTFYERSKRSRGLLSFELVAYLIEMFEDALCRGNFTQTGKLLSLFSRQQNEKVDIDGTDMDLT